MGDAIKNKLRRIRTGLRYGSSPIEFDAHIFNFDNRNAKITFQIIDEDDEPVPLVDVKAITIPLAFVANNRFNCDDILHVNALECGRIVNGAQGVFEWLIPTRQLNHTGDILGEIAIEFNDGSGLVPTQFRMSSTKALITKPLPPGVVEFYIRMFDELRDYILQRQAELEQAIANNEQANNQNQTELEARMTANEERLLQHIQDVNDAGIVMQGEFQQLVEDVHGIASTKYTMETSRATFDNSRDGKLTNRKVEGVTRVNVARSPSPQFDHATGIFRPTSTITPGGWEGSIFYDVTMIKPSTPYSIVVDVFNSPQDINVNFRSSGANNAINVMVANAMSGNGRHVRHVTSQPSFLQQQFGFADASAPITPDMGLHAQITILEGFVTEEEIEHILPSQLHSVGEFVDEISVTSIGENLFDGIFVQGSHDANTGGIVDNDNAIITRELIPVRPNSTVFARLISNSNQNFIVCLAYDFTGRFIGNLSFSTSGGLSTIQISSGVSFIRLRTITTVHTAVAGAVAMVSYNPNTLVTAPHIATPQSFFHQNEDGQWGAIPDLKGIMVDGNLLVADEVTETEYIQRVAEVDLETVGISGIAQLENTVRFRLVTSVFSQHQSILSVMCNKLPTTNTAWEVSAPAVAQLTSGNADDVVIQLPISLELASGAQIRQYLIENDYRFLVPLAEPRRYPIRSWDLPSHYPVTNLRIDGAVSPRFTFSIATSIAQRLELLIQRVANLESWRNEMKLELDLALANLSAEMMRAEDMLLPQNHFHNDVPISDYPLGPSGMRIESPTLGWPHPGLRVETFRYADNAGVQRGTTMGNIEVRRIASGNSWGAWTPMPTQVEIEVLVDEIAELKAKNQNTRTAREKFGEYVNKELVDVKSFAKVLDLVQENHNQELGKLSNENKRLTKLVDYLCSELEVNIEEVIGDDRG